MIPWAETGAGVAALLVPLLAIANRRLKAIVAEFQPNHGSSIRDSLDRIESGVSENKDRIHAIAECGPRATWESNVNGLCTRMSATGLRWLGVQEREILGNGWVAIIWPADRDRVRTEWASSVLDQREFALDYSWCDSRGNEIPVSSHSYPLRDRHGKISGWVGVVARREQKDPTC
jgi:PAS domain S-box-containing protein